MSTLDRGLVISLLLLVILHVTPAVLQLEQGVVLSHRIFRTRQTSHYEHVNVFKVCRADEHTALGNDLLNAVVPSSESVILIHSALNISSNDPRLLPGPEKARTPKMV